MISSANDFGRSPWATDVLGHRCEHQTVDDRISAARCMTAGELRDALAFPSTQKTVRSFIRRRLWRMSQPETGEPR